MEAVQVGSIIYLDTERKFSPERLLQIVAGMNHHSPDVASSILLSRVLIISPTSLTDLSSKLKVSSFLPPHSLLPVTYAYCVCILEMFTGIVYAGD